MIGSAVLLNIITAGLTYSQHHTADDIQRNGTPSRAMLPN